MQKRIEAMREQVESQIRSSGGGNNLDSSNLKNILEEFMTALEELKVADEELRTQNEELIASRQILETERLRYQELFEMAPDAYLVTDHAGLVREANQAALELLNIDYRFVLGRPLVSFIPTYARKSFRDLVASQQHLLDLELPFKRRGAHSFEAAVRMACINSPGGQPQGFRWIIRDIDEMKRMTRALKESQDRFLKIFQSAATGIVLLDPAGRVVDTNPAFKEMLSAPVETLHNTDLTRHIYPEDRPLFSARLDSLSASDGEDAREEIRFLRPDGSTFCGAVSFSTMLLPEAGQPTAVLFVADITSQKQLAEERAEMKHRLIDGIEAERSHLARELHDNPLQTLYGVLFLLAEINNTNLNEQSRDKLGQVGTIIHQVVGSIRELSGELRSASLNQFGLEKGILAYIDHFKENNPNFRVHLQLEAGDPQLPEQVSLALYRILQESLANVTRHSNATQVEIYCRARGEALSLRIVDNGKGFLAPVNVVELMRSGHYGLAGITERAEMIGGDLMIDSAPGSGTVVEVTVGINR